MTAVDRAMRGSCRNTDACADLTFLGTPALSLQDAGALLGISDRLALKVERAAIARLRKLFDAARVRRASDLLDATDIQLSEAAGVSDPGRCEYSIAGGWFPMRPLCNGSSFAAELKDAVTACAVLHALRRQAWKAPIFLYDPRTSSVAHMGCCEGFMWRPNDAVFKSMALRKRVSLSNAKSMTAKAVIETVDGEDEGGPFSIPVVARICVAIRDICGTARA